MLVNQSVAGLCPEIRSKLIGLEVNFSQLLAKTRFERPSFTILVVSRVYLFA